MGHPQEKEHRLYIPKRDKTVIAKAKPAVGKNCTHEGQVKNAFALFFSKYHDAMKDLSKV